MIALASLAPRQHPPSSLTVPELSSAMPHNSSDRTGQGNSGNDLEQVSIGLEVVTVNSHLAIAVRSAQEKWSKQLRSSKFSVNQGDYELNSRKP